MAKVTRFEDLIAWQRARSLATSVYAATREYIEPHDRALAIQMQRAAVSVVSNIAEGYERNRRSEFRHFLTIAKGSCGELRAQMYIAFDVGYLDERICAELMSQAEETSRVIAGLRRKMEKPRTA